MGLAIIAHDAGPVQSEDHRQVLQADVVDNLVIGPLQEGRINGYYGNQPHGGNAGGHGDGVLFADAYIEDTVWELPLRGPIM